VAALRLHDVDDAAKFAAAIATRSGLRLSYHDHEDLEQFLLVEIWRLSERYEPGGINFSTLATVTLKRRLVDWQRQRFGRTRWQFAGRTYERVLPQLVSLDGADGNRLADSLAAGTSDSPADRVATLAGLLPAGDRQAAEDQALIRRLARRAAR
jgi:DNA-directed RNA polymerase specialized sigma24 family protein